MANSSSKVTVLVLCGLVGCSLVGCATTPSAKEGKAAQVDEYEIYYPTGSRIPVKVKKNPRGNPLPTDEKNRDTMKLHQDIKNDETYPKS